MCVLPVGAADTSVCAADDHWRPTSIGLRAARGADPRLLLLSSGALALSHGRVTRPTQGDSIVFSTDGGRIWVSDMEIFAGVSSGHTRIAGTAPERILCVLDSVTAWGP